MYLGIDLGTSNVKALLVDEGQQIVAEASEPLEVSRPRPLWSEQEPSWWWKAVERAVAALRGAAPAPFAAVRGIGLSGQMHGATLLDAQRRVLRPAILWNDGRSGAECVELEEHEPRTRSITGNAAMPGFTAPKLLWVRRHEPAVFARTAHVLLPKDWLRLGMTGDMATDPSDASGTLWLDVERRSWSSPMLDACGMTTSAMPRVVEGSQPTGTVRPDLAAEWGLSPSVIVAAGGGDNACGAVGVGVVSPGQALLSMGTSGVVFLVTERFAPFPRRGVHAFCHAIPATWHQMSVMLSAASCLAWMVPITGARDEADLLARIGADAPAPSDVLFLPYLSGERTPHNDPHARGVFFGMTHATTQAEMARAVLEGVAFAYADGVQALRDAGGEPREITGDRRRSAEHPLDANPRQRARRDPSRP